MSKEKSSLTITSLIKNKWSWIIVGFIFILIAYLIYNYSVQLYITDDMANNLLMYFSLPGFLFLAIGAIWWLIANIEEFYFI